MHSFTVNYTLSLLNSIYCTDSDDTDTKISGSKKSLARKESQIDRKIKLAIHNQIIRQ